MKNLKIAIAALVLVSMSLSANAQQVPMYTHYMYNTLVVNPGYAGSRDALTVTGLHRSQWVDFNGAPLTQTLTIHSPLRNEHIGLGLAVMNDRIGPVNNTSAVVDFAYIMQLSEKSKLGLGLSAGANVFQADLTSLELDQQLDPAFQNNISNHFSPSIGFGAYYYRERFYAGVSVPNLIQTSYLGENEANGSTLTGKEERHYFLIAGTMLNITNNLVFKPTTLIKLAPAAPIQVDLTGSFIIMNKLLVGVMFRTGDAFGGLIGYDITEQFHIGYSFDWSYGLKTAKYNQGSHELVLRYDFLLFSKKQIHSPRNF